MHTNMLTVNGVRMSKSAGNGFLPHELFTGEHPLLKKGYTPMSIRFFMLQAHYRSTLDFSNDALDAAEKGFKRLMNAMVLLKELSPSDRQADININELEERCYAAMNDDFNSPVLIAELFEGVRIINGAYDEKVCLNSEQISQLKSLMEQFVYDVLGLKDDILNEAEDFEKVMDIVVQLRNEAKENKDYVSSDRIRDSLQKIGIQLKDNKSKTLWLKN